MTSGVKGIKGFVKSQWAKDQEAIENSEPKNRRLGPWRRSPKSIFFSPKGPSVYIATVTKRGQASGYRMDVTKKAVYCIAAYIKEMEKRTGESYGMKTPFGILRLVEEDDLK